MLKFHGGVMHFKALEFWQFAGRNFCVSFAYPEHVAICHEVGQSVMLDNGAFSLWKDGKPTDWPRFYEWAEPWLRFQTTWACIPDVMDGTEAENDALIYQWQEWAAAHGLTADKGSPVYHLPESLERLDRLCAEWPLVCLGVSSERYGRINSPPWRKRMEEVMDVACDADGYPRTRLHLLRGLAFTGGPYPIYSADSASVARSWAGSPKSNIAMKDAAKFYASFDGRNPPARWVRPAQQEALFAEEEPQTEFDPEELEGAVLLDPNPQDGRPAQPLTRMASNRVQGEML